MVSMPITDDGGVSIKEGFVEQAAFVLYESSIQTASTMYQSIEYVLIVPPPRATDHTNLLVLFDDIALLEYEKRLRKTDLVLQ